MKKIILLPALYKLTLRGLVFSLLLTLIGVVAGCGVVNKAFEEAPPDPVPGAIFRANPQLTGVFPSSGIIPKGEYLWKADYSRSPHLAVPVVANGVVYSKGTFSRLVFALNAKDGELLWTFEVEKETVGTITVAGEAVFIGSAVGLFYALSSEDGTEVWRFRAGGPIISSSIVFDGMVYFGCEDNNFYALDARTGQEMWRYDSGSPIESSACMLDGIIYFGSGSRTEEYELQAIDAKTGDTIWRFHKDGYVDFISFPCVSGGMVFFNGADGYMYALDAGSGKEAWEVDTGEYLVSPITAYKDRIYFGDPSGNVRILDQKTGEELWRVSIGTDTTSPISIADNVLYVSSVKKLHALDCDTGQELWSLDIEIDSSGLPAIIDGVVYISTGAIK